MQVQFYGQLAERFGARHIDVSPDALSTGTALRNLLADQQPAAADMLNHSGTRLVVNDEICDWAHSLSDARSIAIIPVVSGG